MSHHLPRNVVLVGDAVDRLRELPDDSVDTVVTSPPYYGLRDYQTGGQIGLEASVHGWVRSLVSVTDELARVLKPTGSLWLNLGDSYSRHPRYGAPPKGLLLAPERLLLALAGRGWRVRNKVVWAKPNPLPASVQDRLTAGWEPLYLLVRSPHYYFDLDAIRVPHTSTRTASKQNPDGAATRLPPPWAGPLAGNQVGLDRLHALGRAGHHLGKNPGDVWTLATSSRRDGHHAAFPETLIERPILATCPAATCRVCGIPWRQAEQLRRLGRLAVVSTLSPSCKCNSDWQPGVVLDPFIGSGTTAVVAERFGRDWLGIEIKAEFAALTERRLAEDAKGERAA